MVKISIELEAILEGEKLKDTLITKFKQIGLLLPERHVGLNLGDMPEIASLTTTDDKLELTIKQ